jgi:hypothetical protein
MKNLLGSFKGKYRICLVAVYLGRLSGWLPVWLRSCELNPQFSFLLFCDRPEELPFRPANLRVERTTLSELKDRFSAVAGFQVSLINAYKLCDFRPVYGSAFADLLRSYDFWGHTDLDLYYVHIQKRNLPDVDARTWRSLSNWVFTPQGFVASPPVVWNQSTLRSFNRPSYPHLISHNWRGALRRMKKSTCLLN